MSRESFPLLRLITGSALAAILLVCIVGDVAAQKDEPVAHNTIIAYVSRKAGEFETDIYVRDVTLNEIWIVSDNDVNDDSPVWSPDGRWLLYICGKAICILDWNSRQTISVDFEDEVSFRNYRLLWASNGRRILFSPSFDATRDQIYLMEIADGIPDVNSLRPMSSSVAGDRQAAWSPDGEHIAFSSIRDGNAEIYLADADGQNLRNLTQSYSMEFEPVWSPDGQYIAFSSNLIRGFGFREIYIMDVNGNLLPDFSISGYSPVWYADNRIGYIGLVTMACQYELDTKDHVCFATSTATHLNLTVSPDGRYFTSSILGKGRHYTLLIDSQNVRIGNYDSVGGATTPAWMP